MSNGGSSALNMPDMIYMTAFNLHAGSAPRLAIGLGGMLT